MASYSEKFTAFYQEFMRVKWMALAAVAITVFRAYGWLENNAALLLLYKPALSAIGFITAHIAYQQAFPYIDQGALMRDAIEGPDVDERRKSALLFAGASVLRGLIYAAFILGVTLGL